MKQFIARIPIPFCGVALAIAALGPLLERWASWTWPFCGVLSGIMIALFIVKIVLFPRAIAEDLNNPVLAGVAGTFPMALLNLATYLARWSWHVGFVLWIVAIALFAALIVRFTLRFAKNAKVNDLTPAYFVIYVGALAASTTAPAFGMQPAGLVLSWVGLVVAAILAVLIAVRVVRSPLPELLKPMLCIFAAPPSMCLAAYASCATDPATPFICALYIASCAFYLVGLVALLTCLRLPFYPTYAAMTFPFVIAAAASWKCAALLASVPFIATIAAVQTVIAALITAYVLVRYAVSLA